MLCVIIMRMLLCKRLRCVGSVDSKGSTEAPKAFVCVT
jgi:hypothetical protein